MLRSITNKWAKSWLKSDNLTNDAIKALSLCASLIENKKLILTALLKRINQSPTKYKPPLSVAHLLKFVRNVMDNLDPKEKIQLLKNRMGYKNDPGYEESLLSLAIVAKDDDTVNASIPLLRGLSDESEEDKAFLSTVLFSSAFYNAKTLPLLFDTLSPKMTQHIWSLRLSDRYCINTFMIIMGLAMNKAPQTVMSDMMEKFSRLDVKTKEEVLSVRRNGQSTYYYIKSFNPEMLTQYLQAVEDLPVKIAFPCNEGTQVDSKVSAYFKLRDAISNLGKEIDKYKGNPKKQALYEETLAMFKTIKEDFQTFTKTFKPHEEQTNSETLIKLMQTTRETRNKPLLRKEVNILEVLDKVLTALTIVGVFFLINDALTNTRHVSLFFASPVAKKLDTIEEQVKILNTRKPL